MNRAVPELLVIRHPETQANVAGRLIGRGDSPITPRGIRQTAALAGRIARWVPDAVYTSPLARAARTARAVAPEGVPVVVLDDLAEIHFGDAEGLTWRELRERGMELDYSGGPVAPGGEIGASFDARVRGVAEVVSGSGERAAVITHGGVFRHLLAALTPMTFADAWNLEIPNASVATLVPDGVSWRVADVWVPED